MATGILLGLLIGWNAHAAVSVDAREMRNGVTVPQPGAYTVWAWVTYRGPISVTVAGTTLVVERPDKVPRDYTWVEAGAVTLSEASATVSATSNVATVVLSNEEGYDPAKATAFSRVFDQPERVTDARETRERHTDTVFTMPTYADRREWEVEADTIRRRTLIACGLWPLPEKTPLYPLVSEAATTDGVIIEKVAFEAYPGFFATGNLYRPDRQGRFPAILCPHGHWEHGRLEDTDSGSVPRRCMTLAKMGAVVFSIDMVGYNDSQQFEHRWSSSEDALWGIHPFALQLWSNIRAVDFLESLPYVNGGRIACTGASGGGTQTFALCAVDDRIDVSAPVNMISSTMQGGCVCENAPLIRLDNSNMEIGACMAPRPMLMVSATGDWTTETLRVEYPAIKSIYSLYGKANRVKTVQITANHNYNQASREAMYRFFAKSFLDKREDYSSFTEPELHVPAPEVMRVFPDGKLPDNAFTADQVRSALRERAQSRWATVLPDTPEELEVFHKEQRHLPTDLLGASLPAPNDLRPTRTRMTGLDAGHLLEGWVVSRQQADDAVPLVFIHTNSTTPQDTVLVVHGEGKAALFDATTGQPGELLQALLGAGKAVVAIDAFLLGEHNSPFETAERHFEGGFQDTFHPTVTGERVQDILTALAFIHGRRDLSGTVDLIGLGDGGIWSLFAAAAAPSVRKVIADVNGFDNTSDAAWVETEYIPCVRAVGGLDTMAALIAPRPVWIMNTGETFDASGFERVYTAVPEGAYRGVTGPIGAAEMASAL